MTNSFRLNIELAMPRKRRQVIRLYYSDRRMGAEKNIYFGRRRILPSESEKFAIFI